jgi:putative hemolysin
MTPSPLDGEPAGPTLRASAPTPAAAIVVRFVRVALAALLGAAGAWASLALLDQAWPGLALALVLVLVVPSRVHPRSPRLEADDLDPALLDAVMGFGDLPVGRIMTPRTDLVMLAAGAPWAEVLETVRRTAVSRIPVYGRDRDDVIGLLMAKDLLRFLGQPPPSPRILQRILHPAVFVPIFRRADDCLADLRKRRVHAALVVDEHGSLAGLVSLDDLLGELLGEVRDETDAVEPAEVRPQDDGSLLVHAGMDVEDFAQVVGVHLPPGDYATLGGFILSRTHALPRHGQVVEWEGLGLEVEGVVRRRITDIRVRHLARPAGEESS